MGIKRVIKDLRLVAWIAFFATALLTIQLYLIIEQAWGQLDLISQIALVVATFVVVLTLGYSKANPERLMKGRR